MRIAVVGAAGSGKTTFANKLKKEENNLFKLVDNIPQKFIRRTKLNLELPSDFRTEIMLLGDRLESMFKNWDEDIILTSSVIDSLVYQSIRKELYYMNERWQSPDFSEVYQIEKDVTAAFIGVFAKSFEFDKIYFLEAYPADENSNMPSVEQLVEFELRRLLELSGEKIEFIKSSPRVRKNKVEED